MSCLLEELRSRGFVEQTTDESSLSRLLDSGPATVYAGYDPTADSLHVGNLVPTMALVHFQRAGHRVVVVLGGGTGQVGDPSGKSEMRKVLSSATIDANGARIREQLGRYLILRDAAQGGDGGLVVNNAEWLLPLNYIGFLREIGRHFSVNRMLTAESVKLRLDSEAGLSFLEFNYSILQAYDFLILNQRYGCQIQVGGNDQWGNIVAGIDLIRRVEGDEAHALTFPLVTTSSGRKMGKTEKGSVWLAPDRTTPYDYYQYWINTEDGDVGRFLRLFTLLELDRIAELETLEGKDLRRAKEVLAFEATALTHGRQEAERAREAARALFGGAHATDAASIPTHEVDRGALDAGIAAIVLFCDSGLCPSRGAARRLARQGGLYLNGVAIAEDRVVDLRDLEDGVVMLRAGKKRYCRVLPR